MRNRGLNYSIRDGFVSLKRNPLILLASLTTMMLMLFLVSLFLIFALNASHLLEVAAEQPPIEIQFKVSTDPANVQSLASELVNDARVVSYRVKTPEENFNDFKQKMGKTELFDEFDYVHHIPYTIELKLDDPSHGEAFREQRQQHPGVRDVLMETELMRFLQSAVRTVSFGSIAVFAVLAIITIFIISNMIRVAALSRSVEISIMKYMGATNSYITIPFIIEGVFVGFIGAFLASVSTVFLYIGVYNNYEFDISNQSLFALLPPLKVIPQACIVVFVVGILLGAITSHFAVRRYVQV